MKSPKAMTSGTRKRGNQLTNWLCVSIDSTGKSWRKRQTTLDGYVAGLTSKRPHIWDFSWAAARNRSLGLSTKILKVIWRLTGFSQYTIQMVLTTHCSFKAMSLKMAPTAGTMGRMYVPRTEEWVKNFPLPRFSSGQLVTISSWWSLPMAN